jgi:Uma2 family endonuclease
MSATTQPMTAEELLLMPRGKFRYELLKGELRKMSPAGSEHGAVIINLTLPLAQHVKANKLGVVFGAETGFKIARNPDTVLAPDIAFVRLERIPESGIPKAGTARRTSPWRLSLRAIRWLKLMKRWKSG